MELTSGQIVTVDWRRDPLDASLGPHPPEPNKLLPQHLTCVAKTRIRAITDSRISPTELQQLRQRIALAIGGLG